ncbi:MAG: xanthine dehydrogenase family protein subunit M [Holophagales bacterium]|nr:xanthine dehydrogenase family protein subunit M [Holophagales bacterium]
MKPAPFEYFAPETVEEAVALLAEHGDDAKVLAGGQSYIPAMNFRLARAAVLVDLNRVPELFYIEDGPAGTLRIGAMTRQRTVERSEAVLRRCPLVHGTLPFVAHAQIRNRGTFGGSIAHADPAAELPAVLRALGGSCRVRSSRGERVVPAHEFFTGLFETALEVDDLLVEVELPAPVPRSGWGFHEMARRHGDYALAGVAVQLTLSADGTVAEAGIALLSVGDGPVPATEARQLLLGEVPTVEALRAAAHTAGHRDIDPPADLHASAAYRRHLAEVLTRRALTDAVERARADTG